MKRVSRGAQLHPRHIAQGQDRAVRVGAHDDILELLNRGQASLRLYVQLQLLLIRCRPSADATDSSLNVLRLQSIDHVIGGQFEPGQSIGPDPGAHGIVLRAPKVRVTDAWRALDLIEQVDGDEVGNKQRVMCALGRIDCDDPEQARRLLLDRDALALDL